VRRGGFIFRSQGPWLKVHYGQCLTTQSRPAPVTNHHTRGQNKTRCDRDRDRAAGTIVVEQRSNNARTRSHESLESEKDITEVTQ
jgi:hypothetical protein